MRVKEIMKQAKGVPGEATVNAEESIDNAAVLMKDNNLSGLSVVNDKGKVIGRILKKDLIKVSDELNENFFLD